MITSRMVFFSFCWFFLYCCVFIHRRFLLSVCCFAFVCVVAFSVLNWSAFSPLYSHYAKNIFISRHGDFAYRRVFHIASYQLMRHFPECASFYFFFRTTDIFNFMLAMVGTLLFPLLTLSMKVKVCVGVWTIWGKYMWLGNALLRALYIALYIYALTLSVPFVCVGRR